MLLLFAAVNIVIIVTHFINAASSSILLYSMFVCSYHKYKYLCDISLLVVL